MSIRYWISWFQPGEDYRPLTFPPNEAIRGWWCSGYTDTQSVLCAVVDAKSEKEAEDAILMDWPDLYEWRFIEIKPNGWVPGDRFPPSDWMVERLTKSSMPH